jgi:hypothetical protein
MSPFLIHICESISRCINYVTARVINFMKVQKLCFSWSFCDPGHSRIVKNFVNYWRLSLIISIIPTLLLPMNKNYLSFRNWVLSYLICFSKKGIKVTSFSWYLFFVPTFKSFVLLCFIIQVIYVKLTVLKILKVWRKHIGVKIFVSV